MLLDFLLIPIFALHLLVVNVALAGPLWCVWLSVREQQTGNPLMGQIGRRLAQCCLILLLLGVGLGFGMLALLAWMGNQQRYLDTLGGVPTSRWWGIASELAFYALCIVAYVAWWPKYRARWWHRAIAIVASSAVASHLPPLFAIISAASARPELTGQAIDRHTYYSLLFDGEIVARTIHHWLAAAADSGAMLMLLAARARRQADSDNARAAADRLIMAGARAAFTATLCQIPVGIWVLMELAPAVRDQLMGADLLGTLWMIASLVMAVGLLHHLATIALGDTESKGVVRAAMILVIVTVLMVGTLHHTRTRAYELLGPAQPAAPLTLPSPQRGEG